MTTVVLNAVTVSDSPASSDAELLERFIAARDQAAFAELVRRHSGIVLGVCRRVLSDPNDIDDVFQATFLVLVRDAARVRKRASLASWLYGVAYRLSLHVARTKQRRRETGLVDQASTNIDLFDSLANQHDQEVLDDELNELPEKYRQILVLRYLSGKSPSEIARDIGTTIGSVEGLIKRGKELLGSRLLKRGVNLGVALMAIQCTQQALQAAVPQTLINTTIQASLAWDVTTKSPPVDLVSHQTAELVTKEIVAMTATTKTTLAVGLTVGGLLAGMGGIGLMNGPGKGSAQAAGLHSTISTISAVGHEVEMAAIAADPVEKVAETKPQAEKEKTTPTAENTKNFGIGQPLRLTPGMVTKWDYSIRSPRVEKIEKELTAMTEVDFQAVTLREAVDYFKSLHRVEILIDRKAFEDEGKTNDLQVELQISAVSLKTALRMLLEPYSLDYIIKNDNLIITTAAAAENHMETRVYDARRTGLKSPEALIKAIEGTIQGEHVKWSSKDGEGGVIQPLETALVIRQTQRVHEQIIDLLEQLERLNEAKQNQK